jgi:hypothetical protein
MEDDGLEVGSLKEENLSYLEDKDDNSVNSVDVSSVFSESDRESLDIAMSLMNDSDLQTLQDDSVKIQGNVKAWMLRRNYQTLREATVHLKASLEDYYGEPMSGEQNIEIANRMKEAVVAGTGWVGRDGESGGVKKPEGDGGKRKKNLNNVKSQALASLVIRKNMLGKAPGGRGNVRGGGGMVGMKNVGRGG